MKIYYDADCGICNKCKKFCLKFKKENSILEFLDMNTSIYKNEIEKTIVVVENIPPFVKGVEYRYGKAIKQIFKKLKFPFNLFGYLPTFIITFFYIILREIRKKYSKKICKV